MSVTKIEMPEGAVATLDDGLGFVALVDRMQSDPALKVVNAARISYSKQKSEFSDGDRKLAGFLWEHGHTSPYRHSFFTFHWKAPLFVFRQAFKYQVGSGWREYEVEGESVALDVYDVLFDTDKGCSWNRRDGGHRRPRQGVFVQPLACPLHPARSGGRRHARRHATRGGRQEFERQPLDDERREVIVRGQLPRQPARQGGDAGVAKTVRRRKQSSAGQQQIGLLLIGLHDQHPGRLGKVVRVSRGGWLDQ
jgi:hypothetical protein